MSHESGGNLIWRTNTVPLAEKCQHMTKDCTFCVHFSGILESSK